MLQVIHTAFMATFSAALIPVVTILGAKIGWWEPFQLTLFGRVWEIEKGWHRTPKASSPPFPMASYSLAENQRALATSYSAVLAAYLTISPSVIALNTSLNLASSGSTYNLSEREI
jgi:hypothetical protein